MPTYACLLTKAFRVRPTTDLGCVATRYANFAKNGEDGISLILSRTPANMAAPVSRQVVPIFCHTENSYTRFLKLNWLCHSCLATVSKASNRNAVASKAGILATSRISFPFFF